MTTLSVKDQLYYRERSLNSAMCPYSDGRAPNASAVIEDAKKYYDYLVQHETPPPADKPAYQGQTVSVCVPAEMLDRVKVKETDTVTLQELRRLKGHEMDVLAAEIKSRGHVPA